MARGAWIYDRETQQLVPKGEYLRRKAMLERGKPSSLPRPFVIGTMEPIKSMADGQIYDDKRSYHRSVARAGCEVVGFDDNWTDHIPPAYDEKAHEADLVQDIKRAIEEGPANGG